jgi:hypothetical protein
MPLLIWLHQETLRAVRQSEATLEVHGETIDRAAQFLEDLTRCQSPTETIISHPIVTGTCRTGGAGSASRYERLINEHAGEPELRVEYEPQSHQGGLNDQV